MPNNLPVQVVLPEPHPLDLFRPRKPGHLEAIRKDTGVDDATCRRVILGEIIPALPANEQALEAPPF